MARVAAHQQMTCAEYLAAEAVSDTKHEFLGGEVFAMAGGTPLHAALAAALTQQIGSALVGKPCRMFSSDLRVKVLETGLVTYPDLSVVCSKLETDAEDPHAVTNPTVLVEVLSDSSEGYDRGAKAAHYRRIPSLREYVLVSQTEPMIEVYRRNASGRFELFEGRAGERVVLESIAVELDVDAVYVDPLARG